MTPYYETELGKLYHGDCLEIMPKLNMVEAVITDPPWGTPISCKVDWVSEKNNFLPKVDMVLLEGGSCFCFWNAKDIPNFQIKFQQYFNLKNIIIVWKRNMVTRPWDKSALQYQWEPLFYGKKGKSKTDTGTISCEYNIPCGDVWSSVKPQSNFIKDKRVHDAQKAISIIKRAVVFSDANIILDPFFGSGTLGVACEYYKKQWIGIEIEEKYCEIAVKRIEKERSQLKLFT